MEKLYKQHEKILNTIDEVVEDEILKDNKSIVCDDGCFYCCTFPVPVAITELFYIIDKINKFQKNKIEIIIKNIENSFNYSYHVNNYILNAYYTKTLHNFRTICPFMNEGSCMIYEFRPTNCRTQFSTNINLCQKGQTDINFYKNPKVKSLVNMTFSTNKVETPKKAFLHNAFIFDGNQILVDPIYIFEDDIAIENRINISNLID